MNTILSKLANKTRTFGWRPGFLRQNEVDLIRESRLFDANWYREQNRLTENVEGVEHYVFEGAERGLAPHPLFDVKWYLEMHPSCRHGGQTPLTHFITNASRRKLSPTPLFDAAWYVDAYPHVIARDEIAFRDYVERGALEELDPHPLFSARWYLSCSEDLRTMKINPLTHFIEHGWKNGCNPSPYFDVNWYTQAHRALLAMNENPLRHFIVTGHTLGLKPSNEFDEIPYRARHPNAGTTLLDAFVHMVRADDDQYRVLRSPAKEVLFGEEVASNTIDESPRVPQFDLAFKLAVDSNRDDEPPEVESSVPTGLADALDRAKLVSLDVWDTLLRRDCHPDEIKLQTARYLYLTAYHDLRPAYRDTVTLFQARKLAEDASAPNTEFEYRFTDALPRWLGLVLEPGLLPETLESLRAQVFEHELRAELRGLRKDDLMAAVFRQPTKPMIFTSDFYLPKRAISSFLEANGFGGIFVKGYVSCEAFETKRSGKLFERILEDFREDPADILHIGDNQHADVEVPASKGIATYHYKNESWVARQTWYSIAFEATLKGDTTVHARRLIRELDAFADAREGGNAVAEALGVRLAPMAVGYILNVIESAITSKANKVFFFTREGQFLKKLYDRVGDLNPYNCEYPRSKLLEVSRRATFAASLETGSPEELMKMWSLYSSQSLSSFVVSLNLDEKLARKVSQSHGLGFEDVVQYPWQDARFRAVLQDARFAKHLQDKIAEQKASLLGYLEQSGFETARRGLNLVVDVGWRGTIQDNLCAISKGHLKGHYLGLFGFLNKQPPNSTKIGWLGDANIGVRFALSEVAPLEMLFNGTGGSVLGYRRAEDGCFEAERLIVAGEEAVVQGVIAEIQQGILAAVPVVCDYVRRHGLTSAALVDLGRAVMEAVVERPHPLLADAFASLHHNETFGTGGTQKNEPRVPLEDAIQTLAGSELHHALAANAIGRWPSGAYRRSALAHRWSQLDAATRLSAPPPLFRLCMPAKVKSQGGRFAFYVPAPIVASGGHRTIFNLVKAVGKLGFEPHVFLEGVGAGLDVVENYLEGSPARIHLGWRDDIPSDVAMATIAHSAQFVRNKELTHHRTYLVQDFEAYFNPLSDGYVVGENSYANGLQHFTVGSWLSHVIQTRYGQRACPSGLGIDVKIYHVTPSIQKEHAVCLLYQPDKLRRAPIMGMEALRILKKMHPEVKIYVYGSTVSANLDFEVENLGLIHNLSDLNKLYNRCKVGLCISLSNPSRIPYEMMAAGCIPVDLFRYNNLFDHVPGASVLAYQSPASLAAAMYNVLDDQDFDARSANAAAWASNRTLAWEQDVMCNGLLEMLAGRALDIPPPQMTYHAPPVCATHDESEAVRRFCEWQVREAFAFEESKMPAELLIQKRTKGRPSALRSGQGPH